MKHIGMIGVMLALAVAGCKKPQGPQTTEVAVMAPARPGEDLMPGPMVMVEPEPMVELETETSAEETAVPPPPPPGPRTHTIRKGDTLWSLAKRYLGGGQRWKEIAQANPAIAPKALPIGKTIVIPDK